MCFPRLNPSKLQSHLVPSLAFQAYRTLYRKCPPKSPRLPFLPMSLKDLRFVADGNSQSVNNLLNFDRLRILANYAVELASTTHIPFKKLKYVSPLDHLISSCMHDSPTVVP